MQQPAIGSIRNIGIISHIDAGKTTVSERILYYSGETHKMGEVDDGLAVMDWMPQEQERGITVTASSTSCRWGELWINLIDTPGHIDFTIEVERTLRVLDGAVAIFSAVEGVQPQSESVWRQAERYRLPRLCFINKMDRVGADYRRVLSQLAERLQGRPLLLQLPIGNEGSFAGVIDLLDEEVLYFAATDQGKTVQREPIPPEYLEAAKSARNAVVEAAADFDDAILADFLAGAAVSAERLRRAIRSGTLACQISPVLLGAALRNKGIQPLLDAVGSFLPSPLEIPAVSGREPASGTIEMVSCDQQGPLRALAFKVLAEQGRKLTYLRIYAGVVHSGETVLNSSRGRLEKVARLFRMHAHRREQIEVAAAGDIVAATGLSETFTGDTLCDPLQPLVFSGIVHPEPVVMLAVEPLRAEDRQTLPLALEKLGWEDPTFKVREEEETGQTILVGMGELHLEIITDRLAREFGVTVKSGPPRVVYRETISRTLERRETYSRREPDGKTEAGEVLLRLIPLPRGAGAQVFMPPTDESLLPPELRAALEEILRQLLAAGSTTGYPLTDLEVRVVEAPFKHGVTTEIGLKAAAQRGLLLATREAGLTLLEPVMAIELVIPADYAGKVIGTVLQKRGRVEGVESHGESETIRAQVPLTEMFGYMTELRSATKGRGTYTMEFSHFDQAPAAVQRRFGLG